jgi:hypothetical protein
MLGFVRDWWLDRKDARVIAERVERFASADLLFVSFTKSGRTWVRVLLSNLYARRYGLSDKELINAGNFHALVPAIPRVHFAPDIRLPYPELGPAQVQASARQRVVFLLRDPRDVALSLFFHVKHRAGPRELRRKKIPRDARDAGPDRFVLDEGHGAPRVIRYLNRWAEDAADLPTTLRLRYEDLLADTRGELERLADFIGIDVEPAELDEVVAFAAFLSMQAKEREGYFNSGRLGRTSADDAASGKVPEGKAGGHRDHLRPETVAALDQMVAERLDPRYGYR